MSGSRPISSTACPACVLPQSPWPGALDANFAPGHHRPSPRRAVSSPEVVGGGDQSPFRPAGGSAAALEAIDPAVELRVGEYRLDRGLTFSVKRVAQSGL